MVVQSIFPIFRRLTHQKSQTVFFDPNKSFARQLLLGTEIGLGVNPFTCGGCANIDMQGGLCCPGPCKIYLGLKIQCKIVFVGICFMRLKLCFDISRKSQQVSAINFDPQGINAQSCIIMQSCDLGSCNKYLGWFKIFGNTLKTMDGHSEDILSS